MAPPNCHIPDLTNEDWKALNTLPPPPSRAHPANESMKLVCIGYLNSLTTQPNSRVFAYITCASDEPATPETLHIPPRGRDKLAYIYFETAGGDLHELIITQVLGAATTGESGGDAGKTGLAQVLTPFLHARYLSRRAGPKHMLVNLRAYCHAACVLAERGAEFIPQEVLRDIIGFHEEHARQAEAVPDRKRTAGVELDGDGDGDGSRSGSRKRTQNQTALEGRKGFEILRSQDPTPYDLPHGNEDEPEYVPGASQELIHRPQSRPQQHHPQLQLSYRPLYPAGRISPHGADAANNNGSHSGPNVVGHNPSNVIDNNPSHGNGDKQPPTSDPSTIIPTNSLSSSPSPAARPFPPASTTASNAWTRSFQERRAALLRALVQRETTATSTMDEFEAWSKRAEARSIDFGEEEQERLRELLEGFRGQLISFMSEVAEGGL